MFLKVILFTLLKTEVLNSYDDTNKVGKRRYLDGKDVSNKIENGKQMGRSGLEYEAITHFYNMK